MAVALLTPQTKDPDLYGRELILNYLLAGTGLFAVAGIAGIVVSFSVGAAHSLHPTVEVGVGLLALTAWLMWLSHARQRHYLASYVIISLYFLTAAFLVTQWGLHLPAALLLFGFVIIVSGILISARFSLYMVAGTIAAMAVLRYLIEQGLLHPDLAWKRYDASVGDLFNFFILYSVIALVCWLFNRQMEQSLRRARRSEAALRRQKALLETKVNERGRQLAEAQFEKVQQVYRFAELGRLSSVLFHDMANHLASVSLDIEGLRQDDRSEIMNRVQGTISYIDDVVQRVRQQLYGNETASVFNVSGEINEIIKVLGYKARQVHVHLELKVPADTPYYKGDVTRFRQIINNLVTNAIEAYPEAKRSHRRRRVLIECRVTKRELVISVTDWGKGIDPTQQAKIFEPFYSTKDKGTGIGLFIVQQIVEQDMHGHMRLTSNRQQGTSFQLRLPRRSS